MNGHHIVFTQPGSPTSVTELLYANNSGLSLMYALAELRGGHFSYSGASTRFPTTQSTARCKDVESRVINMSRSGV